MTADGLRPGQSWAIAPGPTWQARADRTGRVHVIGRTLAEHPLYRTQYLTTDGQEARIHMDEWTTFDHASRMARMSNQGGDA